MATIKITKSAIDSLHAGERDQLVWDTKLTGFGLKVTPSGSKVFIYQYRLHGGRKAKVRRYTIGKYGALTADKARGEAERLAMLVAQGIDPQAAKVQRRREAVTLAFDKYLERFVDEHLKADWPASWKDAEATLQRFALPVLKDKPLPDIGPHDIRDVLAPVRDKPATARKVWAILSSLFNWSIKVNGDLKTSPLDLLKAPKGPESRDRWLEDWELVLVWKAAGELGDPFGPLVRLLILNGARREEVAGLPWKELRQSETVWNLPADRAKNGEAAEYALSPLSVAEIDGIVARLGKGKDWPRRGLLFTTTGKAPVSGFSKAKKRLDAKVEELNEGEALEHWTLHDLRRTLATGMQRLKVRFEVTEALLNHKGQSRSGVAGIYQRHDWKEEKRAALLAWSNHIESLLTEQDETNVVQLADARA